MANLMNTLVYFVSRHYACHFLRINESSYMKLAVEDLKAIGASFSQLITSTMISRLVLNLRSVSQNTDSQRGDSIPAASSANHIPRAGNPGEELEDDSSYWHDRNTDDIRLTDFIRV